MKVTEGTLQAVVMRWVMGTKHHEIVVANSNTFLNYSWETDLVSVTKAGLTHEFEIKISKSDYAKDAKKFKHQFMGDPHRTANYFWYVTYGFQIVPPTMAGWITVHYGKPYDWQTEHWYLQIEKEAPRLHTAKLTTNQRYIVAARLLSWRTAKLFQKLYAYGKPD